MAIWDSDVAGDEVQADEHAAAEPRPIPVTGLVGITTEHGALSVNDQAADFGAYSSIVLAGTEAPAPLLPYDVQRKRAVITCSGTGPVYIGSIAGVTAMRNGATTGQTPAYILPTGGQLVIANKQQVFIAPDGTHTATVSLLVERWETA